MHEQKNVNFSLLVTLGSLQELCHRTLAAVSLEHLGTVRMS